jgi:C-terminal processing protease CtpA/Prc
MKLVYTACFLLFTIATTAQTIPNTLSAAEKIYGLSKFWQEVNYNFVYLNKIDRAAWDNTYKELISTITLTKNDYEYYRELQKFCSFLKDGHTNVFFPPKLNEMVSMFGSYRLFIENVEGKAIITRTNLSKKDEIPLGTEILEVNGLPAQTYIKEKVTPYISSSTDYVLKDESYSRMLQGLKGDTFIVKLKKPTGDINVHRFIHLKTDEKEVYPAFENENLMNFKWLDKKIAYLALNSFGNQQINKLFVEKIPELYNAKALVIDLRYNGGGNTNIGREILQYITTDTLLYGSKQKSRQNIASFKAWGKYTDPSSKDDESKKFLLNYRDQLYYEFDYAPDTVHLNFPRIVVPTVILIGHNTASAAEDFLIYADNQKHMIKIGENSFGSTGQPYQFDLPGGGSARICTKQDTYPDGREFVGVGVKPDIEVKKTLKDYIDGKDPVLNKAMEYLKAKLK